MFDAFSLGFLATFGRSGYGPGIGNMEIVRSVGAVADVPGGGVDAADTANNRIQAFDAAGNVVAAWGIAGRGAGYVTRPGGIAFAPDGGVAVADTFDHRIALFAADGTFAGLRGQVSPFTGYATQGANPGQFSLPEGVAYDAAANLWVADTGNDRVVELAPSGAVLFTTPPGLVAGPAAVAVGADGTYVADTGHGRVLRLAAGGVPSVVLTGLSHPAAVAVGPDGTPYVADDTTVRNALTGTPIAAPEGGTTWDHPAGLAVAPDGTLVVAERRPGTADGARIVRGTRSGAGYSWDTIATESDGPARVIEPTGLALSADGGTLLVADTGNNRVLRLDAPGHSAAAARHAARRRQRARPRHDRQRPAGHRVSHRLPPDLRNGPPGHADRDADDRLGPQRLDRACAPAGDTATCTVTIGAADLSAGAIFTATPPPPAPTISPPQPAPRRPAVRIIRVHLPTHRLHLARPRDRRLHRRAQPATRARVTVTLSRPATLTIGVEQGRPGRRQGSTCRPVTRANRRQRRCTRFVALRRSRTLRQPSTSVQFTLTPDFAGPPLPPGSYHLTIAALDPDGNRVGPLRANFRVTS